MPGFVGNDAIAKGQAWTLEFRVFESGSSGKPKMARIALNATGGATGLTVEPLKDALSSGDKLLFGDNTVITLTADAAAGSTALTVSAIPGPLYAQAEGRKLRDLTGFTCQFEVLRRSGDADAVIASADLTITLATQTGDDRGKVSVTGLPATTTSLSPRTYYAALWRRNSGSERPLWEGDWELRDKGFL